MVRGFVLTLNNKLTEVLGYQNKKLPHIKIHYFDKTYFYFLIIYKMYPA